MGPAASQTATGGLLCGSPFAAHTARRTATGTPAGVVEGNSRVSGPVTGARMGARRLRPLAVRFGRCVEPTCGAQTGPLIGKGSLPLRCPPHREKRRLEIRRRLETGYPTPPRRERPPSTALMVCDWPDCETPLNGYRRRWCAIHARETYRAYWRERARSLRPPFDRTARECAGEGCKAIISVAPIGTPKERCGPCARKHRNRLARQRRRSRRTGEMARA